MNHHFRSYSEQPLQPNQQPTHLANSMNNNAGNTHNNNNGTNNHNNISTIDLAHQGTRDGVIEHSDSQLSLDRLFNPPSTQSTVPLRSRNLPRSFFQPNLAQSKEEEERQVNSLHNRSTSYNVRRNMTGQPLASVHTRTQSTLAPMTGMVVNGAGTGAGAATSSVHHPTNGSNHPVNQRSMHPQAQPTQVQQPPQQPPQPPVQQPQLPQPSIAPNIANQMAAAGPTMQPMEQQQRRMHYRNFSSPAFMNNNNINNTPAAAFYNVEPTPTLATQSTDIKAEPTGMYYADMETVSPVRAMADTSYVTQTPPSASYSSSQAVPHDYYSAGPELPVGGQASHFAQAPPTRYFAGNDPVQQQFHITHSQPYMPYEPALSTSSSSNENNSLLCIPTPAVHSRSCSFDTCSCTPWSQNP